MRTLVAAGLALALFAIAAAPGPHGSGAAPGPAQTRAFTLDAIAFGCPGFGDGVCLAYGGPVPATPLDVNVGDTLVVTLRNKIAETLDPLDAPAALKQRLAATHVSWHVHGTALPVTSDGIAAHPGTALVASTAPPGGSYVYTTRAAFAGTWHFHDHVLGADGDEGAARGLYGSLLVRNGAEPRPSRTLDLHLLDEGPNGGRGLTATVPAGATFELVVVGLGDTIWQVAFEDPDGVPLLMRAMGPGMSDRVFVEQARPGAYAWTATWGPFVHTGEVIVG